MAVNGPLEERKIIGFQEVSLLMCCVCRVKKECPQNGRRSTPEIVLQ